MVFPFIPVITAAVGVAGTVAQISAQNAQVQANNRAIDSQISSNERLETIRRSQVALQNTVLTRQAEIDRITRHQQYAQELNNIETARLNETRSRQADIANIRQTAEAYRGQIAQGRNRSTGVRSETANQLNAQRAQVANTNAQAFNEYNNQLSQVNLDRNSNANLLAQLTVAGVNRGRTSRNNQVNQIEQLLPAIQQLAQVQGQTQLSTEQNEALLQFVDNLAQTQLQFEQQELNRAQRESNTNAAYAERIRTLSGDDTVAQLNASRNLARGSYRMDMGNLRLNTAIQRGNLITGSQLASAQSAIASSQLAAQRQVGMSPLSQIAAVAGSLSPLVSLFGMQRQSASQQQPQPGMVQTPIYNQLQDVPGRIYG